MSKDDKDKKKEPENKPEEDDSFGLDMDFEEALERFMDVDISQVKPKTQNSKRDTSNCLEGSSSPES